MARDDPHEALGRRERQIMDVVYRLGRAAVSDVIQELADPPSYSAVRGMLGYLERKGYLRHEVEGNRYLYMATTARTEAQRTALGHVVRTFFGGSRAGAVAALLDLPADELGEADLKRLRELVERARGEGR